MEMCHAHFTGARCRVLARSARSVMRLYQTVGHPRMMSLHCALAAAQCIVIGPVCGFVAVFVCLFVCLFVGLLPR